MANEINKNSRISINADAAIETPEEDSLDRRFYAESVADRILEYDDPKPLVIGIYGPWGYGKSSFLNLISYYLKKKKAVGALDPIEFNPWVFSQTGQLVEKLFLAILRQLRKGGVEYKRIALIFKGVLNVYAKVFSPRLVRVLISLILILSYSTIFYPISIETSSLVKLILLIIVLIILVLSWASESIKAIIDYSIEILEDRSLEEKKKKIENELLNDDHTKIQKKIIIIFDDLDRLMPDEIMLLLKTIKSVINIKGIIILLALDDDAVRHTLRRNYGKVWEGYLDKIVNIPIFLPAPDKEKLATIVFEKIREVSSYYKCITWNEERWQEILMHGLKEAYLKHDSLRAIYRYINRLLFFTKQYPSEVNIIDLLAMESIRMFYPELYLFIYRNKGLLIGEMRAIEQAIWEGSEKDKDKVKEDLDNELAKCPSEAISVIEFLFPRLSSLRETGEASFAVSPEEIADLRICAERHFDKYFIYHLSTGTLSQMIINDFIINTHLPEEYTAILQKIIKDGYFEDFAGRFEAQLDKIDDFNIEDIVVSLFNISEAIPYGARFTKRMDSQEDFLHSAITKLLLRLDRVTIPYKTEDILRKTDALYLPVRFTYFIEKWNEGNQAMLPPILKPRATVLKEICAEKIIADYNAKNLINRKGLRLILECWKRWDMKNFVAEFIKDNFGRKELIGLLAMFIDWDYGREPKFMMDELEKLVSPDVMRNYITGAYNMEITDDDRHVLGIFGRGYAKWRVDTARPNKSKGKDQG